MTTFRNHPLLWIGLTGTLIFGTGFLTGMYRAFWGDETVWWTHQTMRLPIEEARDSFELYIGGELLNKRLSDRTLFAVDKNRKQVPVAAGDIAVRLNNWDKIRASFLISAAISGFFFGVSICLLAVGVVQYYQYWAENRE